MHQMSGNDLAGIKWYSIDTSNDGGQATYDLLALVSAILCAIIEFIWTAVISFQGTHGNELITILFACILQY